MKLVKIDEQKLEREKQEKISNINKEKERREYLNSLREDSRFQTFVIDEIIKRNISDLTDTRIIKKAYEKAGGDIGKKNELGDIVLQSIMASSKLEKMLSELLN